MILQLTRGSLASDITPSPSACRQTSDVESSSANPVAFATWAASPYAGAERRLVTRLEGYWRSLRRCARGPFFEDFWPSRNPVLWSNCALAHIREPGTQPVFDHIGRSIIALFKPAGTNIPDEEWLVDAIASQFGNLGDALATAAPIRNEGRLERRDGIVALYRSVLLPFVDLEREPVYVLAAVTFRFQAPSAD